MECAIYISNKSQYLKNEERYRKTIDGVPLSLQEFFQIRKTKFSFHLHFKPNNIVKLEICPTILRSSIRTGSCEMLFIL